MTTLNITEGRPLDGITRWARRLSWGQVLFTASILIAFLATFTGLHLKHEAQVAVAKTGTVQSFTSRVDTYQCGTVGQNANGTGGTPIYCDQTVYPSDVLVSDTHVTTDLTSEPRVGTPVTLWHVDGESWSTTDPHSGTQVVFDLVFAFLAGCLAAVAALVVALIRDR